MGKLNTTPGYTAFTAYKLVHDYTPTHVKHTAYKHHRSEMVQESVILGEKIVIDSRPHRLKGGYSTLQFDVEITGQGEVLEYPAANERPKSVNGSYHLFCFLGSANLANSA